MAAAETCKAIFNLYSSRTSKSECEAKQHTWSPKGERFANTQSPQHKAASDIFSRRAINAGLLLTQGCSDLTIPCSRLHSGSYTQHGRNFAPFVCVAGTNLSQTQTSRARHDFRAVSEFRARQHSRDCSKLGLPRQRLTLTTVHFLLCYSADKYQTHSVPCQDSQVYFTKCMFAGNFMFKCLKLLRHLIYLHNISTIFFFFSILGRQHLTVWKAIQTHEDVFSTILKLRSKPSRKPIRLKPTIA